ncbi:MAG TPA: insulinase family protein [Polyangiaceae bacterium LLY-WYZ-15_(1-7)]|nr:peptidase M16 [Myxococcales bacterium]MAT28997.1 peptidase M16 [Sandaracinus sp.]HJL04224.1 insulinase family protein [Polyangiaceae bacterium LLY-WYZ-15_(1-7)]HJL08930.1 insulinase family protein [Polyangiaceae bacterium LLY-WYZ-15_(1-7)]HJL30870.1 insulinase family protein [Polyangiaceae bacterium LLY-WYZ-15_(1-7)]
MSRPDTRSAWRAALALFPLALACGGASTPPPEIPPIDEEVEVEGPEARPVEETVRRMDLGVPQLIEMRSESPVVTIRVAFDAGSAEDPRGQEGLTRLAAKLMVEGGAGERSYRELTEALYPMAGAIDAATGRDQTVFVGRVHRDHLEEFYALFRDVLLAPRFEASDFERLQARAKSALTLELRGNDDEALGKAALQAMLYEGHPYAHPPLGTESGLEATTREAAAAQAGRVFCAGRAIVGVAGGYPEGFAARVLEDVAERDGEQCVGRIVLPEPEPRPTRVMLVEKDAASVAISMGMPIGVTRDHPDYAALTLAAAYLGQHRTFAGRLMQKMRGDRGLNYGDYAYVEHFDQEGWTRFPAPNRARRQQYFSIWIRPVQREQAHFALRMAVRELELFRERGLSAEDFERIRTFADRYYALYLQTESRRLGFAIDDRLYDTVDPWLETLRSRWAELDVAEVNAAIRRHIEPSRLQVAVVTPDAEAFADTLASEAPSPIRYRAEVEEAVREEDREVVEYEVGIPRSRMRVLPVTNLFE